MNRPNPLISDKKRPARTISVHPEEAINKIYDTRTHEVCQERGIVSGDLPLVFGFGRNEKVIHPEIGESI